MTFISALWNLKLSAFSVVGSPYKNSNKKHKLQLKNLTKITVWK